MTPLPKRVMFVLFLVMFFGDMTSTMCLSYLPKMVKSFGMSEVLTGRYAGFISTSVYSGYVMCSIFWGYVGDKIGNKRTLIITLSGLAVATILFGLSTSFYWALFSRLAQGLFLGFNVVAKSVLAKSTDESNVSLAFSIYFTFWTMALTMGPSLGGFLAFPVEQYPNVFEEGSFLDDYPTLLPNVVIAGCLLLTIIAIIALLPDDEKSKQTKEYAVNGYLADERSFDHRASDDTKSVDSSGYCGSIEQSDEYSEDDCLIQTTPHNYESCNTLSYDDSDCNVEHKGTTKISYSTFGGYTEKSSILPIHNPSMVDIRQWNKKAGDSRKYQQVLNEVSRICSEGCSTITRLFRIRNYVICLLLYALSGFAIIGVEEVYPLFAATSKDYNGLELTTSEIGIVLLCASSLLIIIQITTMSTLCKRFGPLRTFIGCSVTLILTTPLIPATSSYGTKVGSMVSSVVIMMTCMVLMNGIYISINILVNNTVHKDVLGSANGVAWTASCVGRLLAAVVFGNVFSWSLTNVKSVAENTKALGFPFNQFFVFFIAALIFLIIGVIAKFCFSADIERPTSDEPNRSDERKDVPNSSIA